MAKFTIAQPNLVNGVSQQDPTLRLDSQAEAAENIYPSVVDGLRRRPPTEHVSVLQAGVINQHKWHVINRDQSERYLVMLGDNNIRVFDLSTGAEKTVHKPDGVGYITIPTPRSALRLMTIADYTFVLNAAQVVSMDATTVVDPYSTSAIIFVKIGNATANYSVEINGVVHASYTGNANTDVIASQLAAQLAGSLGAGWTIYYHGPTILLIGSDHFTIRVIDSGGGSYLVAITRRVQRFDDLPAVAVNGYIVEVVGDNASAFDNYYLKFQSQDGVTLGYGQWVEHAAPGRQTTINPATMPHVLIRNGDGTFTFRQQTWTPCIAGDTDSNPPPSFVGRTIAEMFMFKGRLGFVSGPNVSMSSVEDLFDFWRTTVTTLLDGDRIDVTASHNRVVDIKAAIPFDEQLLLFSQDSQFFLRGAELLTAREAQIAPATNHAFNADCLPVDIGRTIFFTFPKGGFTGVREFFSDTQAEVYDAADASAHIPRYIPSGAFNMAHAPSEDLILIQSTGDLTTVYGYKFYWANNEKLQSAWFKWNFNATPILHVACVDTTVYLVVQRAAEVTLERVDISPGVVDEQQEHLPSRLQYLTHLDQKVKGDSLTRSYNPTTGYTSFTLPYRHEPGKNYQVVSRACSAAPAGVPGIVSQGLVLEGTHTIKVEGDWSTTFCWIGQSYLSLYQPTNPVIKQSAENAGKSALAVGRTQVRNWFINFARTGWFTVTVSLTSGTTSVYRYNGRTIGAYNNAVDELAISSGQKSIPVLAKSDEFTLVVSSDTFLPFHLISAEFEVWFHSRSPRYR